MKKTLVLMVTSLSLVLSACGPTNYQAIVKPEKKEDDIVISPELKDFLRNNPNPVVVLRVPYTVTKVTEAEQKTLTTYNNAYNQIEKNLMKAGFTVRDRGLLNNLLSTGQADYAEIGKKIQTDLILEIQSVDFEIENMSDHVIDKNTGKTLELTDSCFVNPVYAKLECKIVIVDRGQTGAVLTLYYQTCKDGCDVEVLSGGRRGFIGMEEGLRFPSVRQPGDENWHQVLKFGLALNEESTKQLIDFFSVKLARILRGQ